MSNSDDITVSTNEEQFILNALKSGLRVDGRDAFSTRALRITLSERTGQADVQYGRTRVVATVTGDIVEPYPDRENEGMLNFFVAFSPMASPSFDSKRPSDRSVEISRVVERGIRESRAIDTEALCIVAKQKVWSIRCDITIVDHEGNLLDCVNLAAVAALLHFRRPDVTVLGDRVTVHAIDDRQPVPLSLHHIPICNTFAFFSESMYVLDPSLKEELISRGGLTITLNQHGELCCIHRPGGVAIEPDTVMECLRVAKRKTAAIVSKLQEKLKEYAEDPRRKRGLDAVQKAPLELLGGDNVVKHTKVSLLPVWERKAPQAPAGSVASVMAMDEAQSDDEEEEEEAADGLVGTTGTVTGCGTQRDDRNAAGRAATAMATTASARPARGKGAAAEAGAGAAMDASEEDGDGDLAAAVVKKTKAKAKAKGKGKGKGSRKR